MMKWHLHAKIIFAILGLIILATALVIALNYNRLKQKQPKNSSDIIISLPKAGATIVSPLDFSGQAKGSWFFEASFPVKLIDSDGNIIASTQAAAQGDWMTQDFVSFTGRLQFNAPKGNQGSLVFENDNPSGLPQNHKQFLLPISFGLQSADGPGTTCAPNSASCKGDAKLCMETNKNKSCN